MPPAAARQIEALVETVDFPVTDSERGDNHGPDDDGASARLLLDLAAAARDRRPVTFDYTSRQGDATQRTVEPHGVVAHRGLIYLTAFDRKRQAARTFRVDRINRLQRLEGTFAVPADAHPVRQVLGPLPPAPHRHPVSVRIHADVAHVCAHLPATLASVTPVGAGPHEVGWLRVVLHAELLAWVAGKLAAIDRPFVIDAPQALRDEVRRLAERLMMASQLPAET